ncbi:HD domain-containing protein [Deinococcus cellulosilyticus]|uniref:Haloacid dehalogenase n=1 Tax=Deinococcus cellulosilyticus (strain DSM 18568 / NBRC 106333 / KACC 11606 / 5516J-15) TaxID=1223518 RepID=A0A511N516_DEIC1|nr:HD domain-containing protein [Deinococcus cellulosilyticus]GEM47521.1 haloacid dehalogenase [Deinococcus cellulosilyticus NBRC 106333 = KACC 11606]
MTRDEAYELMCQHTPSDSLRRHMLNVEAAMRHYARLWEEDEEQYAIAGLLHDFDYELHPEEHPFWGVKYLQENTDVSDEIIQAILGHASYSGVKRETKLAKTLFAVDELTGLVQAAALIRPDKDIKMLELSSVKKRFKNKAFAAGVNRDEVQEGAQDLGVDMDTHMANVLKAMQEM